MRKNSFLHTLSLHTLVTQFNQRFNMRTRYALVVLLALLAFHLVAGLGDYAKTKKQQAEFAASRAARTAQAVDLDEWQTRHNEAQRTLTSWETRLWQGLLPGAIHANIEEQLNRQLANSRASNLRITVDPTPVTMADDNNTDNRQTPRQVFRFKISARAIPQEDFVVLLSKISASQPVLLTDELIFRLTKTNDITFNISGVAPFRQIAPDSRTGSGTGTGSEESATSQSQSRTTPQNPVSQSPVRRSAPNERPNQNSEQSR